MTERKRETIFNAGIANKSLELTYEIFWMKKKTSDGLVLDGVS